MAAEGSFGTRALLLASRLGARLFWSYDQNSDRFYSSSEEDEDEQDGGAEAGADNRRGASGSSNAEPMQNSLAEEITMATSVNDQTLKLARSKKGRTVNTVSMLAGREFNLSGRGSFSRADACHLTSRYLPTKGPQLLMQKNSRLYISQFSNNGSMFVAGFQDRTIVVFDVEKNWSVRKNVIARNLRWTITDTALSPDQRFLVYASITPMVHLVNLGNETGGIDSLANVTDIHEGLVLGSVDDDSDLSFGIWSLKFSHDGNELLAGSNDNSIYVYDLNAAETTYRVNAHTDEVNAVAFADETGNLIYSGSDDSVCMVWDRRCFSSSKPVGKLLGHLGGITFIDSRGDGRHFISNSKDQSIKLWDIRTMSSSSRPWSAKRNIPSFKWDYRYMKIPNRLLSAKHPLDSSVMTYRGHEVLQTLIRCYFSPVTSTGQKYIYTGSYSGDIYIYDVITGDVAAKLSFHNRNVRDCSWHPQEPVLVSSCWGGFLAKWDNLDGEHTMSLPARLPAYYDSDE